MSRTIRVLGVPMDLGQNRRGVDMGPGAIRYAGLQDRLRGLGFQVEDLGNLAIPVREEIVVQTPTQRLGAVTAICEEIYRQACRDVGEGDIALFLGGDHSLSIGSVAAAASGGPLGLIWVDAHADFNTFGSSPSGNLHGMPVAILVGDGPEPLVNLGGTGAGLQAGQIAQIGVRSLDPPERDRLRASGIHVLTMREVDEQGVATVARTALDRLGHLPRLHVSLDLDCLDPGEAPGVGTPVPGGLTYREAHLLMEILGDSGRVVSADVVEINPILDRENRTARLAVELVASLLGQRIL